MARFTSILLAPKSPDEATAMPSKVLIIDDDAMIREVFTLALGHFGYAAEQAADGFQGLEAARTHTPSLIFLDLEMPGISGWETMELLQANEATANIPVVLATSCDVPLTRVREAGFQGYLQKPVTLKTFLEHVRCLLGNSGVVEGTPPINPLALLPRHS